MLVDRTGRLAKIGKILTSKGKTSWLSRWVFEYPEAKLPSPYFSELDGLRGVAVIAVVLYHLDLPGFAGGWLGVDAFFVISGFLITGIIVSEIERGHFHYGRFLLKRAKRLLPALAAMTLVTTVFAWTTFNAAQLSRFGDSVVGVAGYFSNITFMLDNSYFRQSAATTPLLHTWSLAVEEQFYILFPLVLIVVFASNKLSITPVLLTLTSLSLAAWLFMKQTEFSSMLSDWSFYLLPTRAWEFGVGALLAVVLGSIGPAFFSARRAAWGAGLGGGLLAVSLLLGGRWSDSGIPSVLMASALVFLISFARGTVIGKLLSSRFLVGMGALSYGIYLWHFPLVSFSKILSADGQLNAGSTSLVILGTLVAALLSLRFVENPIRLSQFEWSRVLSMVLMFIVLLASLGWFTRSVNDSSFAETQAAKALAANPWVYFSDLDERIFQVRRLATGVPDNVTTVVVGSSRHMQVGSDVASEPVLNLSVSGASLEDIQALGLSGLRVTGASTIFIGADPWMLHSDSGQGRWESILDEYEFWDRILDEGKELDAVNPADIPSRQMVESRAGRLYQAINVGSESMSVPKDGDPELIAKKAQDGSHIYDGAYQTQTREEIIASFAGIASYANMDQFVAGEREILKLKQLLQYLDENKIQVFLVLSPYHPGSFLDLSKNNPGFAEAESLFREIAADSGAVLVGSYDSTQIPCMDSEFFDGMHPEASCMRNLLVGK